MKPGNNTFSSTFTLLRPTNLLSSNSDEAAMTMFPASTATPPPSTTPRSSSEGWPFIVTISVEPRMRRSTLRLGNLQAPLGPLQSSLDKQIEPNLEYYFPIDHYCVPVYLNGWFCYRSCKREAAIILAAYSTIRSNPDGCGSEN